MPAVGKPVRPLRSYEWLYRRAFRRDLRYDARHRRLRAAMIAGFRREGLEGAGRALFGHNTTVDGPVAGRSFRAQFRVQARQHQRRFLGSLDPAFRRSVGIAGPNSALDAAGLAALARLRAVGDEVVNGAVDANARLATGVFVRHRDRLLAGLAKLAAEGTVTERALRALLRKEHGHGVKHIQLLARDQAGKVNGTLTHLRQTALGLSRYSWTTQGDDRVRPTHVALDGIEFAWDGPPQPPEGHPGTPINCRCSAVPVAPAPPPGAAGEPRAERGVWLVNTTPNALWRAYVAALG